MDLNISDNEKKKIFEGIDMTVYDDGTIGWWLNEQK
jgi:hypothetical protein